MTMSHRLVGSAYSGRRPSSAVATNGYAYHTDIRCGGLNKHSIEIFDINVFEATDPDTDGIFVCSEKTDKWGATVFYQLRECLTCARKFPERRFAAEQVAA